jgi:PAS domain S-box-containing protein/putative nucleotidyltransferase with HDIG domain
MKNNHTILLVDDNPNLRKTLSAILRVKGFEVEVAESGAEGMAVAERALVNVALIDLRLPDMSGIEVMEHIKLADPLIEVIILTGHADLDSAIEAANKGAFSYLLKPYDIENLLMHIHNAIEHQHNEQVIRRLASFPELDPDPVIELDTYGQVTYHNPAAGKQFPDLVSQGIQHPLFVDLQDTFATSQKGEWQETIVREVTIGDTTYEQRIYSIPESNLVRITILDITERKRKQTALAESEMRYRRLFEAARDGILILDSESGQIMDVNPFMIELLGFSYEEYLGKKLWEISAFSDTAAVKAAFSELQQKKYVRYDDLPLQTVSGRPVDVEFVSNVYDAGEGTVVQCNVRDISERVEALETLRRKEESLVQAQHVARLGSWEHDLTSDEISWSDEFYHILGSEPRQTAASYGEFLDAIHPDDREMVDKSYSEHMENHTPYDIVYRLLFKDGRISYVHQRVETIYDDNGKAIRSFGTVQDITEQRLAELNLVRLNRILRTLSIANETLVHASDEASLLQAMCNIIVDQGGYHLAWFGTVEHDAAQRVLPVASAGYSKDYLESLQISWGDSELGQGPTGRAVRLGIPQLTENILTEPQFAPWREQAQQHGIISSISFPLKNESGEVFGVLNIYAGTANAFDESEIKLLQELSDDLAFGIFNLRSRQQRNQYLEENLKSAELLKESLIGTIHAVAQTVEKRDPYTAGHQNRVAKLAAVMAGELGLDADRIEGIKLGGMIHDIGKIYVPAEILNRPGKLSAPEYEMIHTHPQVGYDILKDIRFPWPVAEMVLQHHERLDGSGYPRGLKGNEIILEARIMAVADVVEAITSHRPYRPALGVEVALDEIIKHRGVFYDPTVVDVCLALFREKSFTW